MFTKRAVLCLVALCCFVALMPSALFSQSASTGTVSGTVADAQGASVAGATVTLTDTATSLARTTSTNENGRYILVDVTPSKYSLTVTKQGFRSTKLVDQVVEVGLTLTLNVTLEVGSVAETVEVSATAAAELQTMNATVGNTIGGENLANLPTIQRDAATFVTLQPGVSPNGSVAGAVLDQSTFLLDGGQNSNDMDGSMTVYTPSFAGDPTGGTAGGGGGPTGVMPTPLDSVEEYKVNTANQTAEFNSSAGAQVEVVTKRGTNTWHGTAYEYYLESHLNANTFQNNFTGTPIPSYHYNRFGAAGGGPIISKNILGGKTYFFANYEGFRWNNSATYEVAVPSANMRLGILTLPVCTGACAAGGPGAPPPVNTVFNLNNGTNCGGGTAACDPRGLGLNPVVSQLWSKYEPVGNDPTCGALLGSRCDGLNEIGFKSNVSIPQSSNFGVARIDHDFGSKWHFNAAYRYYNLRLATTSQVDVGGFFPGDTLGTPTALSNRPQQPWYFVAGVTTNVTSNTTNDFHYSYLRNYWSWGDPGGVPQFSNIPAALEVFGEFSTTALIPYNVNTQSVRTRFWDGHDNFIRDDWTMLKGNHLFTFGGAYQRNWDYHQRSDNGGGINYQPSYLLGDGLGGGLVDFSSTTPAGVSTSTWARDSAAVLGIVTDTQIAYTRTGSNLALNPPLTHAFDQSTIPYYNVYFSDSWHLKPSITFTYGLGWTLEMPPTEANGKQIELTDASGQPLDLASFLSQRQSAALQGQVYNPQIGFALVGNTANGLKYPYNPFYGSFSPRVALAWNPNYTDGILGKVLGGGKSVVRGGYSRVYGRLNGVDLVLVPLLGDGLIQAVQCTQALFNGNCGPVNPIVGPPAGTTCAQAGNCAFRIGPTASGFDGLTAPLPSASATLPQPTFPGYNSVAAGAAESLDPHFRPNVIDSFDVTIQRQITPKILLEMGYIGRRITHEYQPVNINAVPYMMTLGGQQFAKAYAAVETYLGCATSFAACGHNVPAKTIKVGGVSTPNPAYTAYFNALPAQPFFETALAGTGYCNGSFAGVAFSSCTAATVFNRIANFETQSVWSLWSALDQGGVTCAPKVACGFNFPTSMENTPITGSVAPCPGAPAGAPACGSQGQTTSGVGVNASIGHGNYNGGFVSLRTTNWHGITLQENFTYSKALGTGAVTQSTSAYTVNDPWNLDNMYGLQSFDRKFVFNTYALIDDPWYKSQQGLVGRLAGGWSLSPIFAAGSGAPLFCGTNTDAQSFGSADGNSFGTNENCILTQAATGGSASLNNLGLAGKFNIFSNPTAFYNSIRPPILGLDTGTGGVGVLRGLPYWNMDLRVVKDIHLMERFGLQFEFTTTNIFNHPVFSNPSVNPTAPSTIGVVTSQGNAPRQMQFGLRFQF